MVWFSGFVGGKKSRRRTFVLAEGACVLEQADPTGPGLNHGGEVIERLVVVRPSIRNKYQW